MPGLELHHASLRVRDMAKMIDFYTRVMGFVESEKETYQAIKKFVVNN